GVLNLQGQQTASVFLPPDTTIPVTSEAVITSDIPYRPGNSAIQALPTSLEGAFQYSSAVTATFLQPVFNVSFDAYAFRTAGYSYVAANGAGDFLNGTGTILGDLESGGLVTWQQIGINIPSGYYVTQFSVSNRD